MNPNPYIKTIPEAELLLDIINGRMPFKFDNIDRDRFTELTRLHEVIPYVFSKFQECASHIPQTLWTYLEPVYYANLSRNLKFWSEFLKIYQAFKLKNIPVLPMKGMDLMVRFYPELRLRSMADIDILVKEGQFDQAEKILSELGYEKRLLGLKEEYWRQKQCHVEFDKKGFIVEIHWGLDFKRPNRIILPQLWERVKKVPIENHKIDILSEEDTLFAFTLHLRRFGRILSLKQIIDVARIIKTSPKFDWDYVLKESKEGRMRASVYFILMQAFLFTGAPIPMEIFRKLNIPFWQKKLIKNFILKSTFKIQPSVKALKKDYLKAHLLLYDSPWEPLWYLVNIPYEQFCKFYNLKPYIKKTNLLYKMRLLYMPVKQIFPSHENLQQNRLTR